MLNYETSYLFRYMLEGTKTKIKVRGHLQKVPLITVELDLLDTNVATYTEYIQYGTRGPLTSQI